MIRHYHPDHLGSTQVITNETGDPVRYLRYLPFSDLRDRLTAAGTPTEGDDVYRYEFRKYETEFSTELQYAGARFYDPELSQFLTHDPADSLASPYAYSPADPVNTIDLTGEGPLLSALLFTAFAVLTNAALDLAWAASTGGDLAKAAIGIAIKAGISFGTFGAGSALGATTGFFSSAYEASGGVGNAIGLGAFYALSASFIGYGGYQALTNGDPVGVLFAVSGLVGLAEGSTSTLGQAAGSGMLSSGRYSMSRSAFFSLGVAWLCIAYIDSGCGPADNAARLKGRIVGVESGGPPVRHCMLSLYTEGDELLADKREVGGRFEAVVRIAPGKHSYIVAVECEGVPGRYRRQVTLGSFRDYEIGVDLGVITLGDDLENEQ